MLSVFYSYTTSRFHKPSFVVSMQHTWWVIWRQADAGERCACQPTTATFDLVTKKLTDKQTGSDWCWKVLDSAQLTQMQHTPKPKTHTFPNTSPQSTVILPNYLHLKKSTRITKKIYTCNIPYIWRLVHRLGDNLELPPSRLMYTMTTETDYRLSNIIFNNHDLLRTKLNSPICV